ncbi:MAG: FAD-dependent oxidoreductase [Christensenellales bacterium]
MSKKIVVVGGVAGGATAVARLRRLDENAQILLLERGEYVSFANCGLPYYIGGTIANRDSLFVTDIPSIQAKYNVEIRNFSEVIRIDPKEKQVLVREKGGREYTESYDELLLSTGSTPFVPDMPGKDFPNVFILWNVPDTDRIYAYIQDNKPKQAVVVGGGFIGLELAENLVDRGIDVTLVEFADQVMQPLDIEMARLVENHLCSKGVRLMLQQRVTQIANQGRQVVLGDGQRLDTDMTLLCVGIRPNTALAKEAGLKVNQRGGVIVNERMQTSDPHIYAVGDMIEVKNLVSGLPTMIPLAGPANKQGRAVAANMLGLEEETYEGSMGTSVAKVFDLTVASTGENEKQLQTRGLQYQKDYAYSLVHPMSHAGYYPGATPMTLKVLFSLEDGRVLGAQCVGFDGVDKRIDVIATSIYFKGTIHDLKRLELSYAPPYSNAKDPVNMAGFVAANYMKGLSDGVSVRQYLDNKEQYTVLDVREDVECAAGTIPSAVRIPLPQLRERLSELDKQKNYLVCCAVGIRGYIAERILKQKGFAASNLMGGYRSWKDWTQEVSTSMRQDTYQDKLPTQGQEITLDVCGLSCPGPIMEVSKRIADMQEGETLSVQASDPGFIRDIDSWCQNTGNALLSKSAEKGIFRAVVRKGGGAVQQSRDKEKTMIVFDGDLDKAIAAFIIANGSVAMGNKVNMFFTFWGLNIIKREGVRAKKDLMGRMFSLMLPKSSQRLSLSKMNFGGMGSKMMRAVMKKKGISSLEDLIKQAQGSGVRLVACQMSMDVMGITKEELLDGVEIGGVASMLNDNDRSNMNLFI